MSLGRSNALIQDAFLAEGRRTPEAPALVSSYGRCAFAELAQISGALSVLLSARGVGRGSVVAIFSDRNPALVYCMLGVLRSGAAFHIVDAAYPLPRILACLRQTRPAFVLNAGAVVEPEPLRTALGPDLAERWATVPANAAQALVALGDFASDARPLPGEPADAAYVNFTSGSTGTPKGVVATHAWIPHFAAWQAAHGGLSAADRFTMLSGLSHTPLLRDVFTPLSIGASLHIPEQATIFDAEALWRWFASEQITVANLTPAVGEILATGAPEGARLEHLRRLYWGGDALRPSLAAQLGRAAPRLVQTNLYGTTETAGIAYFDLAEHAGDGPIPIGRGIPGAQLLLVDEHGQLCAPGEIGEIWIRSPYHARGYLDDPAQTRARFVRNPFTGALDDLCYRTGDRGRYLDDGTVVFAGRGDHQVKIRGFRVEPAEIAAAIERLPGVHRALVLARELRGEPQLVAYLVCQGGAQPVPAELRAALRRELPSYMIPRWWTVLADFPLLPNGKIDLQALPLPRDDELGARARGESRRPPATDAERPLAALDGEPATPTEQRLAAIWREVLGVAEVGRHDSFFELGGHSLLAVRTLSRIRAAFSVELALRGVFETSTIEGLARELDRAIDGGLAGGGASTFVPVVPVPPEDRGAALPLPFAQQRLWFLHRLDPDSRAYNQASAHRLRGPLDLEALRRAFEALIDRHEALRTVFPASDGVPRQEVLPAGRFTLPVDDLSQLAPVDREHEAARRAEATALERFDLTAGPVLRARVLRLSAADHILLLEVHHIVADGWSQAVLRRELAALYGAFLHGQPPHLPPLPIQYADYAIWSRRWLTGEVLEGQLAYWKQLLADAPVELPLPYRAPGRSDAPGASFRGGRIDLALDADLTRRLRALAHRHGATLFMVLLAALRALLARTTGQRDLCIGTAIANRDRTEIEGLIGMFANTLVLRGPVHAGDRFVDLLARERDLALAAYAHAHAPFEMVVDALGLAREPDRMPLIQVVCVDQGSVTDELALPGLAPGGIERFCIDLKITPFDLIFDTRERAGIREFTVSYRTALFDRDTIAALVDRYHRLLRGIADQPELPVSQLALLAPAERAALFDEPARRVSWEPRGPTVMAQIERWMAHTPGAPAILWEAGQVDYGDLDARSAALAALLRRRGVGPDRTVAVVAERGALQIIGMVAALRAGGAYVPIKPDLPDERIGWILDETAPVVILCDGPPPAALARHAGAIVRLDEPWPEAHDARDAREPRDPTVPPEALAYIIYTSGSTGRPKGVMTTRRCFDAQLRWTLDEFPIDASARCLQVASMMFDFSVVEIFWPLMAGAAIVLPRPGGEFDPAHLAELAARHAVTAVHFVPSLLRVVVDACQRAPWPTVEHVFCGGEALAIDLIRTCQTVFPRATVYNQYGPTETTVIAVSWRCHPDDQAVPIGWPVADTTAYVLDDDFAPVPPGGVGQLWIGGVQLARGYLQRPALTAERFRPNPFASRPGERIYQTGDLVRQRADGVLECLGRSDFQVKVRGFRIELGEIEAALSDHPQVRAALAVARDDGAQGKHLVAYVCLSGPASPAELRNFISTRLPAYMIPSAFVVLGELPRTLTGKIDRKALPAPSDDAYQRAAYVAPGTPTEQFLAGTWCEVLGKDRVGLRDNFFALGGHSLLAVRAISRACAAFSLELPLRCLFEAPTVESLAHEVDRRRAEGGATAAAPLMPLVPVSRGDALALSSAQHRLWFLHQLAPDSRAYNMPSAYRLRGPLDLEVLRRAFEVLIGRHEALRTVFPVCDGIPHQEVLPASSFALPVDDLTALAPMDREREAARRAEQAAMVRFDLARGPLLHARVLRLSDVDHILLLDLHHIVSDGWSMTVLWRELAALYAAGIRGEIADLAPLPVQYVDYAAWLRRWLTGEVLDRQLAYWTQHLADAPVELPLPYRGPRPPVATFRGGRIELTLDAELTRRLHALAHHHGATLFMVLLAALRTLLARYTGQRDLCIGTVVANRDRRELEGLIGMFVNTLVLRGPVRGGDCFVDVLARERDLALAAYAHAHAPFEQVVDALGLERRLDRMPLIQVMCVDQGDATGKAVLPGLATEPFRIDLEIEKFDLTLSTCERASVREITVSYNADLFDREAVAALVARYERLLASISDQPEQPLSELELLGPAERAAWFDEPARRVTWEPRGVSVVAQIEHWMAKTPGSPALLGENTEFSYQELDARTATLAALLRRRGVGPDRTVAVIAERGAPQIIAFVAALRAGGAYVPIKPDLPGERIGWILDETAPVAILCDGPPPAALGRHLAAVVRLDESWSAAAGSPGLGELPVPGSSPDALAYIIYTSGSTGRPKGVMVTRRGFDAQLRWTQDEYPLGARDRVLQLTSAMFDVSVIEIFSALMAGGALVLPGRRGELEPAYLAELVARHGVTAVHVVPSLLRVVVDACRDTPWTSVEQLFCAGEALPPDLVRACQAVFPRAAVHNQYGPTETTVIATYWRCQPDDRAVPIGWPVADTTAYVLDDDLAPVPPGGVGQLWIGGVQLARGYLARPGLTADRFRPNPFAARPGERIYQTGDLVRQRADGVLEYLGRADFQIKVRGFRIELGEIEATLHDHPQVRAGLVMARDDDAQGKLLVAYVCLSGPATPAELSAFLAMRLPGYMIPSAFVVLDELPRTATGKIDRRALPAPAEDAFERRAYEAPATPTEQRLAAIWREVLGVQQVGRHDSFFSLGGHSLLAARVVARIRARLDAEVPVRAVFEAPTVVALASRVEACTAGDRLPPIVPVRRDQELPLSLAQQRIWFLQRLEGGSAYNIPVALRLGGSLDAGALERALGGLAARHEVLRTTFPERDGRPVQQIHAAARVAMSVVDVSGLPPEAGLAEARRRADEDARRPFDLERGPLLRAELVRLKPEDHVLLLCLHHLVADGWSMPILVRELAAGYEHARRGGEGPVPGLAPLPVQYADVAAWQQRHLLPRLGPQLAYWRHQLAGAPSALELPTDRPRPAVVSFAGARVTFALDEALTASIEALARAHDATLFMVLQSAWAVLLGRYSRQDRVVVGVPVAHRSQAALEPLIGMFVNTLALPNDVTGPSFMDVLRRGRETVLGAFEHQDLPFEQLVEAIQPVRDLSRNPVFQTSFTLEHERPATPTLAGLHVLPLHDEANPSTEVAKFDLSLGLTRVSGGLEARINYSTALFEPATIAGMARQFGALLRAVVAAPEKALETLVLSDEAERAELAVWNATEVALGGSCLHELIAAQAARTPDHVAVIFEGQQLTYGELAARANQLAHHLRGHGVGPDVIVAVLLERSVELVVALVGILQAGGAYLALDPEHPAERLAFAVRDAGAPVLVTSQALASRPGAHGARVVCIDADWAVIARQPISAPDTGCTADHLAYVLYTSGSTGSPKGVMISHRGLSNYIGYSVAHYLTGRGGAPVHSSIGFDLTVTSLLSPLAAGRPIVMVPQVQQVEGLAGAVRSHAGFGLVKLTPSHLRLLEQQLAPEEVVGKIGALVIGGEALSAETLRFWRQHAQGTRMINEYGPTETVVGCCVHQVSDEDLATGVVPIGRPIWNTQLHVLDSQLRPVAVGMPGELCVGGVQVARGYLRRPGLTAERFVPDPFSRVPGARMYRTGDLARYRPGADGVLEFLGRIDLQVKLRGYRIELGEIEAALRQVAGVLDAAVVVRDERLAAYLVGVQPEAEVHESAGVLPAREALRAHLAARLPTYMIPDSFTVLEAFPLTASGKLDRKALPAPADDAYQRAAYVAPATSTEQLLAAIWREVFDTGEVGRHDHFFALGGHSLLVIRLVSQIRRRFGVELSPRAVFESPTIAGQAERILVHARSAEASADDPAERELVEQVAALPNTEVSAQLAEWSSVMLDVPPTSAASGLTGPRRVLADRLIAQHRIDAHSSLPLARRTSPTAPTTFAQQLQWDYHQRGNFPNLGIHAAALAIHGPLDVRAMQQAIADLVERQTALRTTFRVDQGRLTQTIQARGPALDVVDLSSISAGVPASAPAADRALRSRQLFEAISRPHDLTREVFRAQLVRLDDQEHLLFLVPHHIAIDGFSWGVLEADLAALYRARRAAAAGSASDLAPLELQYGDFCFWQRTLEERPLGRDQLAFWHHAVAGYPGLELPGDRSAALRASVGMATDTYEAGRILFAVEGPRWSAVERWCARLGTTPYVAITSGFLLLLSRWSGRGDVCALSSNFHRNRPGSEAVIGNFVTPYPLRVAFDERASLEAAVRHCHDRILLHREHAHVAPSSALAAWVEWSRYNVNYQIEPSGAVAPDFGAARVERLDWSVLVRCTPHDLALFVRQGARGVRGALVYNAERFSPEQAAQAAARLGQLIDLIATEPAHRVGALPCAP